MTAEWLAHGPAVPRRRTDRPATPVRGRNDELGALARLVTRVASGASGVLVVRGGTGSGKTRLLAEARALAAAANVRVASGAAEADAQLVPFAPLLDALISPAEPLVEPELARRLASGTDQRYWVLQQLQEQLERATPLLITIDDVHWADDATHLALRALPERLAGRPIGWVLACRGSLGAEPDRTLTTLAAGGATICPLEPLDDAAVDALAADVLGRALEDGERDFVGRAGGEPLLLLELLHGLAEDADVFPRLRAVVTRRVDQLSESAQDVVRVGAAVGSSFTLAQLTALLGHSPADLTAPLRELVADELVTPDGPDYVFRHDLVREVLTTDLPGDLVRTLRRQAVDVDLAAGRPVTEVADALLSSALPGDLDAVRLLHQAALTEPDPARAADLVTRALDLAPADAPGRGGLVADAVALHVLAGETARGLALAERSLQGRLDAEVEARIRLSIAVVHRERSFTESVRHSATALELAGVSDRTRAQLFVVYALMRIRDYDIEGVAPLAPDVLRLARAAGDAEAESAALAVDACVRLHRDGITAARRPLRAAGELTGRSDPAQPLWSPPLLAAVVASMAGAPNDADAHLVAGTAAAEARGQSHLVALYAAARARFRFDAGDLDGARRLLAGPSAPRPEEAAPDDVAGIVGVYTAGRIALATGDEAGIAEARRNASRMLEGNSHAVRCTGAWLAALIADAHGEPVRALEFAAPSLARLESLGPILSEPPDPADLALLTRIALRAGDERTAGRILARAARDAAHNDDVPSYLAAEAHVRGLIERDPAPLRRAIALLEPGERPFALSAALEDAALAADDPEDAVAHLDRALTILDGVGAHRDAARVRSHLRDLGVRRRRVSRAGGASGWDALTAAELGVVRLIALGVTKREAADRLFLSPHTVNSHVRSAYAKLGIRSRVDLARIVLAQDA